METILETAFNLKVELSKETKCFSWSNEMEIVLQRKNTWKTVDATALHAASKKDEFATYKLDFEIRYLILFIDHSCNPFLMHMRNPRDVFKKLHDTYQ